jgi:hypothetical protein
MMYDIKSIIPVLVYFTLCFSVNSCGSEINSESSIGRTYKTAYGTVTYLDNAPLYSLTYTKDYHFDEYLETGTFPSLLSYLPEKEKYSCTCFMAFGEGNRIFGRNFDWNDPAPYYLLVTDPDEGYASVSMVDLGFFNYDHEKPPDDAGNQDVIRYMPFFPFDGMNEKGVAVGMNALPYSQGPYDEAKVTLGELQVIRLVLDYAASTDEAVELIQQYNVQMEDPPIHYLIGDSAGRSVIIEFIDNEMRVIENTNPWQVTTNFIITNFDEPLTAGCWRYNSAWDVLQAANGIVSADEALSLLQTVSLTSTRWSALYELTTGDISLVMGRDYNNVHSFVLE